MLAGRLVLELASGLAGPLAGLRLGDLGARVDKVERSPGDWLRRAEPAAPGSNDSASFVSLNRGKRAIGIGGTPEAAARLLRAAVARADVVICDWSTDVIERAGLEAQHAEAQEGSSRLVWAEVSDYGSQGPLAEGRASELLMQAAAGYTRYLGVHGRPSIRLGADVAGTVTGIFVLQAVLAALLFRERGGAGQTVSVSQLNSLLSMKSIHLAAQSDPDEYAGPRVGGANHPPEFGWRTADFPITFSFGGSVGETGRAGWKEFVREIGLGWMLTDERFTDDPSGRSTTGHGLRAGELKPEYEKEFVKHPASEIVEMVRRHGGAAAVYQDHTAVVQHEQTVTMGVVGRAGDSGRRFTKFPARFSRLSPRMLENVPGFASDTRTIAHELGFTDHEVDTMVAGGGLVCA